MRVLLCFNNGIEVIVYRFVQTKPCNRLLAQGKRKSTAPRSFRRNGPGIIIIVNNNVVRRFTVQEVKQDVEDYGKLRLDGIFSVEFRLKGKSVLCR